MLHIARRPRLGALAAALVVAATLAACSGDDKPDNSEAKEFVSVKGAPEGTSARWFIDGDRDGHGDWYRFIDSPVKPGAKWVTNHTDCDDADPEIFEEHDEPPGHEEFARLGPIDRNCDGKVPNDDAFSYEAVYCNESGKILAGPNNAKGKRLKLGLDCDGDGARGGIHGGTDCNDGHADMWPGNTEVRQDDLDNDCDFRTPDSGYVRPYRPDRFVAVNFDVTLPSFKG